MGGTRESEQTYLAHQIDRILAQLFGEVIAFDEADAVLARRGAFELDCALDHAVDESFGNVAFGVVV